MLTALLEDDIHSVTPVFVYKRWIKINQMVCKYKIWKNKIFRGCCQTIFWAVLVRIVMSYPKFIFEMKNMKFFSDKTL